MLHHWELFISSRCQFSRKSTWIVQVVSGSSKVIAVVGDYLACPTKAFWRAERFPLPDLAENGQIHEVKYIRKFLSMNINFKSYRQKINNKPNLHLTNKSLTKVDQLWEYLTFGDTRSNLTGTCPSKAFLKILIKKVKINELDTIIIWSGWQ